MAIPVHNTPYWALVSRSGHEPNSPYVTVMASAYGLTVDRTTGDCGKLFTTRKLAATYQDSLPLDACGRALEIAQVRWFGGSVFTREPSFAASGTKAAR